MEDNREFKTVVKTIKGAEKDVDKVLKAARLNRVEKGKMSGRDLEMILNFALSALGIISVLVFMLALFYVMTH